MNENISLKASVSAKTKTYRDRYKFSNSPFFYVDVNQGYDFLRRILDV